MNYSDKFWFQTSVSLILLLFVSISASGQKIGHFNAKYVVSKMTEYTDFVLDELGLGNKNDVIR